MQIKSISASRVKTYDHCTYKYALNYLLYECKDCSETFYVPEISNEECPYCHSKNYSRPEMSTNFGAVHGSALHEVMEKYAMFIRGHDESGNPIADTAYADWQQGVKDAWKRAANGKAIYDLAKPKEVAERTGWCQNCQQQSGLCQITGETLDEMRKKGCQGCPKSLYLESVRLMDKFIKRYDPIFRTRKILGIEKAFNIDFGQGVISTGFIDLITELDSETIEVFDYKFGSWVPSFDEFSEDIQVKLYSLVASILFPQYKEYIITFDYVRKQPLSIAFSREDDKQTLAEIIKKHQQIEAPQVVRRTIVDGDGKHPESSWKCKSLCDVKVCNKEWPKFKEKFSAKA